VHLGPGTATLYEVITKMRTEQSCYSIAEMRLALGVSRSGLYDHAHKNQSERRQEELRFHGQV
jgi:hypothetical protein